MGNFEQVSSHPHPQAQQHSDEIDLRQLAIAVIDGKRWIFGTVLAGLALAVAYLFVATPTYSTAITFAPAPDGLRNLNKVPDLNYSQGTVQNELARRLVSFDSFTQFIGAEVPKETLVQGLNIDEERVGVNEALRTFFFRNVALSHAEEEGAGAPTTLKINYAERLNGVDLINDYFRWTERTLAQDLIDRSDIVVDAAIHRNTKRMQALLENQETEVDRRITQLIENQELQLLQLKDKLDAEVQAQLDSRKERVRVLKQAEQVASRLGITNPTTPRELGRAGSDREIVYAEINSGGGLPLYFMGTEALQAEREVIEANLDQAVKSSAILSIEKQIQELQTNREVELLRAREDNSAFIDEYNSLRKENILLRTNSVTPDEVQIAEVINWAYQPESPDSPKKALVLVLALMVSGMLGLMLLFMVRFAQSLRQPEAV